MYTRHRLLSHSSPPSTPSLVSFSLVGARYSSFPAAPATSHGLRTLAPSTLEAEGRPSASLSGISRTPGIGAPEAISPASSENDTGYGGSAAAAPGAGWPGPEAGAEAVGMEAVSRGMNSSSVVELDQLGSRARSAQDGAVCVAQGGSGAGSAAQAYCD